MRRPLVIIIVAVLAAVAADFVLRFWTQSWVKSEIASDLDARGGATVSAGGFPFALQALRGHVNSASVTAEDFTVDGLRVERLDMDVKLVKFPLLTMLTRGDATLTISRGRGTATVTDDDVTAWLSFQDYPGRVTFLADGNVQVDVMANVGGQQLEVTATGPVRIDQEQLIFEPKSASSGGTEVPLEAVAFAFDLPPMFEGFTYRQIEVRGGTAELGVGVRDGRLAIGD
ncbi:MAG TPA: DUF2993 domain-containing protein [Actinomycetota bacterium]|nr:DUF2993 domain-containing protein [Actinomycetota bacterium]